MSFTISASAGEDSVCSVTNRASLLSVAPASTFRRSTSSAPSSAQRVIPGSYSASQVGQNIGLSLALNDRMASVVNHKRNHQSDQLDILVHRVIMPAGN